MKGPLYLAFAIILIVLKNYTLKAGEFLRAHCETVLLIVAALLCIAGLIFLPAIGHAGVVQ